MKNRGAAKSAPPPPRDIGLSKLTFFSSNFPCYTGAYKTIDRFFQILESQKEKHMSFLNNFQYAHKRIEDF